MNSLFAVDKKELLSDKYSHKVNIPQYLPKNEKPQIAELYNYKKYAELINHIEKADISEQEKKFLRLAATRHIVFNYDKIADYYAHSGKNVQQLFEESALVIIDVNDAIMNGYVELTKAIEEIRSRSVKSE